MQQTPISGTKRLEIPVLCQDADIPISAQLTRNDLFRLLARYVETVRKEVVTNFMRTVPYRDSSYLSSFMHYTIQFVLGGTGGPCFELANKNISIAFGESHYRCLMYR